MYIEIDSAPLFFRIVERFGLPEVTSRHEDEVFGSYPADGERLAFLRYSPANERWDVFADPAPGDDAWVSNEQIELAFIQALEERLRPPPPEDRSRRVQREPFVYSGGRYAWTFLPELRRWAVAPLDDA